MDNNLPGVSQAVSPKTPWYFTKRWVFILIVATVPLSFFAFPLLWFSQKFSIKMKFVITILTLVACYFVAQSMSALWKNLQSQIMELKSAGLLS